MKSWSKMNTEISTGEEAKTSNGHKAEIEFGDVSRELNQIIREDGKNSGKVDMAEKISIKDKANIFIADKVEDVELEDGTRQVKETIMEEQEKPDVMNVDSFLELSISEPTRKAMEDQGIKDFTRVQATAIPPLLQGKDVTVAAQVNSGKTLALLISAVELIYQSQFTPEKGTGVIVLCPSREMAIQKIELAKVLLKYHTLTLGWAIGCMNRSKADQLVKGVNLLIATPRNLLDHLQNTKGFEYGSLKCLMIDDADRILNLEFEDMMKILRILPQGRQTALSSSTQTMKVADLTWLISHRSPVCVCVFDGPKRVFDASFDLSRGERKYSRRRLKVVKRSFKSRNPKRMEVKSKFKK